MLKSTAIASLLLFVPTLASAEEPKGVEGNWVPTEMHQSGQRVASYFVGQVI